MSLPAADLSKQPDNRTTMELGAVLPLTAEVKDDHLYVGGVDMVELAREQGTALYVMDEADMRTRMETYLAAFRSRYQNSDVVYASKAFLNKEAARIVADEGCASTCQAARAGHRVGRGLPDRAHLHARQHKRRASCAKPSRRALAASSSTAASSSSASPRSRASWASCSLFTCASRRVSRPTPDQYIRTGCEDSKFGFTMRDDLGLRGA